MSRYLKRGNPDDFRGAVKECLSMKPNWAQFSTDQQVAGPAAILQWSSLPVDASPDSVSAKFPETK
jgi:hypothetical protein